MTRTRTQTTTHTRTVAVARQFEYACLRLLPGGADWFDRVVGPAVAAQALAGLSLYGRNPDTGREGVLRLAVDWDEHDRRRRGQTTVHFRRPAGWDDWVAPTVRRAVLHFHRLVTRHGLRVQGFVRPRPGVPLHPALTGLRRGRPPVPAAAVSARQVVAGLEEQEVGLWFDLPAAALTREVDQ